MDQQELFDVTIIGGGPAGLYSAFYSGLREMKTKIIEYQPRLGGKIHFYPEKIIWDVGGVAPITGEKLMEQLVKQGMTFDPTVVLNEKIESICRNQDGTFLLRTASGQIHYTKTVLVATGSGILRPKKLEITGAEKFEEVNIHYSITSIMRFKDRAVMISGGGNTAVDWANELKSVARKVYVIYRRENLNGHEASVTQLLNSSVHFLPNTIITKLVTCKDNERLRKAELTNQETGEKIYIEIDDIIINHGFEQDASLLKNSEIQIEMDNDFYIAGNSNCETSVEGIYAAGDILNYDGKLQLIAGCFQDAANAVNKAKQYIQPTAQKFAMVSSHNEVFQRKNREMNKEMAKGHS